MFFIINKTTRQVIRTSETPFNIDENVQPGGGVIQLKRIDDETKPNFDPATQKLVRNFVDDDSAFTRTFSFSVAQLTNGELAAATQAVQGETQRQQIKTLIDAFKNGTATNAQVQKAIAYLLKDAVRF